MKAGALATNLRRRIVQGEWEQFHRLPSEEQLSLEYQTSTEMVRIAYMLLEADGYIHTRSHWGRFCGPAPAIWERVLPAVGLEKELRPRTNEFRIGDPFFSIRDVVREYMVSPKIAREALMLLTAKGYLLQQRPTMRRTVYRHHTPEGENSGRKG